MSNSRNSLSKTLRHRLRYLLDADYRIECIADAVEERAVARTAALMKDWDGLEFPDSVRTDCANGRPL